MCVHSGALHLLSISVEKQGLLITGDVASLAMVTSASAPCCILISSTPLTVFQGFIITISQKLREGFLYFASLIGRTVQCSSHGVDGTGLQLKAFVGVLRKMQSWFAQSYEWTEAVRKGKGGERNSFR